ncbi:MAG: ATP-grasp domain-containing protein [Candidatus Omnitrophota bacterium]
MQKKAKILITGIGSSNALTFLCGLRKEKRKSFQICGADIYERDFCAGAQFCDKFFRVPACNKPSFIGVLLGICRRNAIDVLVPMLDEEMLLISGQHKDFLECGTRVLLPEEEIIKTCLNKLKLYGFLGRNGFPVPRIYTSDQVPQSFPVIQKPVIGRGSHDITIIHDRQEFKKARGKTGYLIQKYIEGREFTVDTLSNLNGKTLAAVPRLRLEIRDGKSIKAQTVRHKAIEGLAREICNALKMTGPACLQCRLGRNNRPYFFDVNPRIGSASILTIEAGVNIPLLAVQNILGRNIDKAPAKFMANVVMLRYWGNIFTYPKRQMDMSGGIA